MFASLIAATVNGTTPEVEIERQQVEGRGIGHWQPAVQDTVAGYVGMAINKKREVPLGNRST